MQAMQDSERSSWPWTQRRKSFQTF